MKSFGMLSAFALAAALLASPAFGDSGSIGRAPDDRSPQTYGDTQMFDGPAGALGARERTSIEGSVTAIEHETGRFELDTEEGPSVC